MMSWAAVGDSIIAWTRADISAIGWILVNIASSYVRIAESGAAGLAASRPASSAAPSMAWLAPPPTGGMRCAASPMRVMPGLLDQRVPMGIASIGRGVGGL